MFETQIQQARDILRRVYICRERDNNVPDFEKVSGTELKAWFSATEQLIIHSFGGESEEISRFNQVYLSSVRYDPDKRREDPKWSYTHWIDRFHLYIGLLQEFEARYEASQAEKYPQIKEIVMGNKISTGNIIGSNVNIDSMLENVTQNIGTAKDIDEEVKKQLTDLVEQLKTELQKAPLAKKEEVEALANATEQLVEAGTKPKPNKFTVQITAEGLKKAAENIAGVMPTVLSIASNIVTTVFRLASIPIL